MFFSPSTVNRRQVERDGKAFENERRHGVGRRHIHVVFVDHAWTWAASQLPDRDAGFERGSIKAIKELDADRLRSIGMTPACLQHLQQELAAEDASHLSTTDDAHRLMRLTIRAEGT